MWRFSEKREGLPRWFVKMQRYKWRAVVPSEAGNDWCHAEKCDEEGKKRRAIFTAAEKKKGKKEEEEEESVSDFHRLGFPSLQVSPEK